VKNDRQNKFVAATHSGYPPGRPATQTRDSTTGNRLENFSCWSRGGYLHDSSNGQRHGWPVLRNRHARTSWWGPPPHRRDFEETFALLEGQLDVVFRGTKGVIRAGETVNVRTFQQMLRISSTIHRPDQRECSAFVRRPGEEEFFQEVGGRVATRTTPPPKLDETAQAEFKAKAAALAPKYRTELLQHA
jgi:mannose-6-phosphate isomerase-like protein (cupin superfamily)